MNRKKKKKTIRKTIERNYGIQNKIAQPLKAKIQRIIKVRHIQKKYCRRIHQIISICAAYTHAEREKKRKRKKINECVLCMVGKRVPSGPDCPEALYYTLNLHTNGHIHNEEVCV